MGTIQENSPLGNLRGFLFTSGSNLQEPGPPHERLLHRTAAHACVHRDRRGNAPFRRVELACNGVYPGAQQRGQLGLVQLPTATTEAESVSTCRPPPSTLLPSNRCVSRVQGATMTLRTSAPGRHDALDARCPRAANPSASEQPQNSSDMDAHRMKLKMSTMTRQTSALTPKEMARLTPEICEGCGAEFGQGLPSCTCAVQLPEGVAACPRLHPL